MTVEEAGETAPQGSLVAPSPLELAEAKARVEKVHAHEIAVAVRNTLRLAVSQLLTWSMALGVKPYTASHLGPVRQGHFGFAESFSAMFFTSIQLGVDTYIIKEVSVRIKHASDFVGGIFALRALIGMILLLAMQATLRTTGRNLEIQTCVAVFGAAHFLVSINATLAAVLQATTHVGRLAVANVAAKFVWGAGLLIGLHYDAPLFLLAVPMFAAELARSAFLVPAARAAAGLRYRIKVRETVAVLVSSLPFFIAGMATSLGTNLALSALEFVRKDEREVGWLSATQNIATLAMLLYPLLAWVIMPMLSRAYARSEEEMMAILRRAIEALLIVIAPITTLISAGSDIFIRLFFGASFAPAAMGLSILSLVFVMTYLNIMLATGLVIVGKSWSVTIVSIGSIFIQAVFVILFVPVFRYLLGTGGECAGAAVAVIATETAVNLALLWRVRYAPFDRRNVSVLIKTLLVSSTVLVVNHVLHTLGPLRLVIDMALYLTLALAIRLVRPDEVRAAVKILWARREMKNQRPSA